MNIPDDDRHERGPVSTDPQSSQLPTKTNRKNAIIALQVAMAGLKAAPIPGLGQIPDALLLLIETYTVSYPAILPGILSDNIH